MDAVFVMPVCCLESHYCCSVVYPDPHTRVWIHQLDCRQEPSNAVDRYAMAFKVHSTVFGLLKKLSCICINL